MGNTSANAALFKQIENDVQMQNEQGMMQAHLQALFQQYDKDKSNVFAKEKDAFFNDCLAYLRPTVTRIYDKLLHSTSSVTLGRSTIEGLQLIHDNDHVAFNAYCMKVFDADKNDKIDAKEYSTMVAQFCSMIIQLKHGNK